MQVQCFTYRTKVITYYKLYPWHFVAFSNILGETFAPNSVSLICPNLQILEKTETGLFSISGFLVNSYKRKLS